VERTRAAERWMGFEPSEAPQLSPRDTGQYIHGVTHLVQGWIRDPVAFLAVVWLGVGGLQAADDGGSFGYGSFSLS
jgi:hypothetical protein